MQNFSNDIIQKIEDNKKITKDKRRIERKLEAVNKKIEKQQEECNHIRACVGWNGPFQYRDTSFHNCLLCGERDPDSRYRVIDATYCKENLYGHGQLSIYREKRLRFLQNLAITIMNENPELTENELVEVMNEVIQKNIDESKKTEQSSVKKLVPNKK